MASFGRHTRWRGCSHVTIRWSTAVRIPTATCYASVHSVANDRRPSTNHATKRRWPPLKKCLKKTIDTAQSAPATVIVAGDEASLYLQATRQVVWAPVGQTPVVKVDPGRANLHFYGALDLQTGKEIVMRATVMKAVSSVLFLLKLVLAYPNRKILLLWDRAPWHFGPAIRNFLVAHPTLEIFYFPPA